MPAEARLDRARAVLRQHRSLHARREWIHWTDLAVTSTLAWTTFVAGAASAGNAHGALTATLFAVAVLALYRASAFLHEISHTRASMPRFHAAWNALVGVPLLVPSILYDGVHTTHHSRDVFGTDRDPEYVQLEGEGVMHTVRLIAQFVLVPITLTTRWLVVAPISCAHPALRRFAIERLSSLSGNPAYRRPLPRGAERTRWVVLELASFAWCSAWLVAIVAGAVPFASIVFALAVATSISVMHGLRSLATHRFHGMGASRTFDEQFLDSINVVGHPLVTELWAPAGLRYHALHHLAPGLPYHALGRAHRVLVASLPASDPYHRVTFPSLAAAVTASLRSAPGESHTEVGCST